MTEKPATPPQYPYPDGDVTVLGPEIFASTDGEVICWKGENYVRQPEPAAQPDASAHAGPCGQHCNHKADAPPECINDACTQACTTECRAVIAAAYERLREASGHPIPATASEPICKFGAGCHRVVACNPGCAASPGSAPATELRERYAAAIREHFGDLPYVAVLIERCTDAVLAVRDTELQQAQADLAQARLLVTGIEAQAVAWKQQTDRVRALHRPVQYRGRAICVECSGYGGSTCDNGPQPHPCPTIAALDPQEPS